MTKNGVIISKKKLEELTGMVGDRSDLDYMYSVCGKSDSEIASETGVSVSWICKLRRFHGIKTDSKYQLRRNKRRFETLSSFQREFLIGSLFGDSCIAENKQSKGCFWICGHCDAQEEYLMKKASIMQSFLSKTSKGERSFEKGGKKFGYVRARSITHPEFSSLRKEFYPNGIKVLNEQLFRQLTGRSFAFWFFDDGSTTGYGFDITTFENEFKDPKYIKLFKEVLDLDVSIRFNGNEGKIHVLKSSHDKAWSYIQPEMIDCMWHKIPFKYRRHDNQQPSLDGNVLEGSTTGGSLNANAHGDNTHPERVILQDTPDMVNTMMIQSELGSKPKNLEETPSLAGKANPSDATYGFSHSVSSATTPQSAARPSTSSSSPTAHSPSMTRMQTSQLTSSVNSSTADTKSLKKSGKAGSGQSDLKVETYDRTPYVSFANGNI